MKEVTPGGSITRPALYNADSWKPGRKEERRLMLLMQVLNCSDNVPSDKPEREEKSRLISNEGFEVKRQHTVNPSSQPASILSSTSFSLPNCNNIQ